MDCFVASAPLRKRFAFVAGNDGSTRLRDLAARFRTSSASNVPPSKKSEGAGNAGRAMRPQPRMQNKMSIRA
jgi:hypothetical protein